jgi:small-conductance mechanosensitive channel
MMDFKSLDVLNLRQYLTAGNIAMVARLILLVFVGIPLVYGISKWVRKYLAKKSTPQQGMIVGKIIFYLGLVMVAISVMKELKFELTPLLGAAGILGMAIGFASQTSLSNIISGLFLITEKPFAVNDVITVAGITGQVLSIDTLSIKLRTLDNKFVRIPNETIVKSEVTNLTRFPIRRLDLPIGVAYKEDLTRIHKILLDLAHENPLCLEEPTPDVYFTGYGASSLDLLFVVWVRTADYLVVRNQIMDTIKKKFDELGIEIPFPHVSVYTGSVTDPLPIKLVASSEGGKNQTK